MSAPRYFDYLISTGLFFNALTISESIWINTKLSQISIHSPAPLLDFFLR